MNFHWMHRFHGGNSYRGMISAIKILESAGVKSILLPYGATGPDYLSMVPHFLENTSKINFMVALRPYALTPEYAIKTFQTINENYGERLWLNVVAGMLVPEEQDFVFKNYIHDISEISDMGHRLNLADKWTKIFIDALPKHIETKLFTIANSEYTRIWANKYFDFAIYDHHRLDANDKISGNAKPVLVIDPLIKPFDSYKPIYIYKPTDLEEKRGEKVVRQQFHEYSGSYQEVKQALIETAKKYKINDFMILTDQKDISEMLKLVRELSSDEYIF